MHAENRGMCPPNVFVSRMRLTHAAATGRPDARGLTSWDATRTGRGGLWYTMISFSFANANTSLCCAMKSGSLEWAFRAS